MSDAPAPDQPVLPGVADEARPELDVRGATRSRLAVFAWAGLALAAGLGLSALANHWQQQRVHAAWRTGEARLAGQGFGAVSTALSSAELMLRSVQSLFLASDSVTPIEFANLYGNLRPATAFPSLSSMAFARREARADGTHYVIRLIEPPSHAIVLGLDISGQPANMAALLRSRDTDAVSLSAPLQLAPVPGGRPAQDAVTLRLPIYSPGPTPVTLAERRARAQGSIDMLFAVSRLIHDALPADTLKAMRVTMVDVSDGGQRPLFDSRPDAPAAGVAFDERRILHFGGRHWEIRMRSLTGPPALRWYQAMLSGGVLASILLALLVFSVARTRQHALELARQMSLRYRQSEARFRTLNELLPVLVLLADPHNGRIVYANRSARRMLGEDVHGRALEDVFMDPELYARLLEPEHSSGHLDTLLHGAAGTPFWASVSLAREQLDDTDRWLVVATDITERRNLTEVLAHQAHHDTLTDLYNRRAFESRLQQALAAVVADQPMTVLLYVDLDQFKLVNDTSGHLAGDQLLVRLASILRGKLAADDVLARLGGDEFGILAGGMRRADDARALAERIRQVIADFVFQWEERSHAVSASIGAVLIDAPDISMKDLLARADTACYMAKELGRNRIHFFSEHEAVATSRRHEMDWANRLHWAADEGRLVLAYQEIKPLQPLTDAGIIVEVLLRYRNDAGELLTPGVFMPAAERYGLMPDIDRWVVATTLAHLDQIHPQGARLATVGINLSGASIDDDTLADWIIGLLQQHRIAPARLCFEITETVAVRNLTQVARFIECLRGAGCHVALDDFGVGMSSFNYLKHLSVSVIKIDGSFVRDMLTDAVSHAMVRAVADIGQRLGLAVTAEHVPDDATLHALVALGVTHAQAFLLHRPEVAVFQRD